MGMGRSRGACWAWGLLKNAPSRTRVNSTPRSHPQHHLQVPLSNVYEQGATSGSVGGGRLTDQLGEERLRQHHEEQHHEEDDDVQLEHPAQEREVGGDTCPVETCKGQRLRSFDESRFWGTLGASNESRCWRTLGAPPACRCRIWGNLGAPPAHLGELKEEPGGGGSSGKSTMQEPRQVQRVQRQDPLAFWGPPADPRITESFGTRPASPVSRDQEENQLEALLQRGTLGVLQRIQV